MKLVESITVAHPTLLRREAASRVPEIIGGLDFRLKGLCGTVSNPDDLFVKGGVAQREAKKICEQCSVIEACREFALTNRQEFGVWGGLTENERRKILRARDGAATRKLVARQVELNEQAS